MASFIDVTGLETFSNLFAFLFSWVILYAIFMYTRITGGNMMVSILVSLFLSLFVLLSEGVTNAIIAVAPFFAILFIFAVLVGAAFGSFGANANSPALNGVKIVILVFFVVVTALFALGEIQGDTSADPTADDEGLSNTEIFSNPKVLGIVIIAIVSVFTIVLLTTKF